MTTTQFCRYCGESVGTRWKRTVTPEGGVRLILPEMYTIDGGRIFFHPMYAVANDRAGFRPMGISSSNIHVAADILGFSPEIAELVFAAANTLVTEDSHPYVYDIRRELETKLAEVEMFSRHTFWSALKERD